MTDIIETTVGIKCHNCGVVNWPTAMSCMGCTASLDKTGARMMLPFATVAPMSFSQKVARFFEIMDYLLLVPASFGLMLSLTAFPFAPQLTLGVMGSVIAGCFLLAGFIKHSRGRLSQHRVSVLWWATIGYNLIDLAITLWVANSSRNEKFFLFSIWPTLVIILSTLALLKESEKTKLS